MDKVLPLARLVYVGHVLSAAATRTCPPAHHPTSLLPEQRVNLHKAYLCFNIHHQRSAVRHRKATLDYMKNTTLPLMHSANRLLPLSSISPTTRDGQAWRRSGVERVNSGKHPCWQAACLLLVYFSFLVFLGISCLGRGGGGVAEGWMGLRGQGEESTCTGSWSGSGTCTCRHHTAGVGPGPGCSLDPGCAAPLGSFSGRPPPPDRGTPGGC